MARKVDHVARGAAVLASLARTANVRLALKEAGVSQCWADNRRRADPDFARRWDAAVRSGRAALDKMSRDIATDLDAEAVPAGMILTGSSGRGTIRLERPKRWSFTVAKRARFLTALRTTCNVQAAARAAGTAVTGIYRVYHKDAAFRAAWDAALAEARVHLEMALIGAARALFEPPEDLAGEPIEPPAITGMDATVAVQLLRIHGAPDRDARRLRRIKPADPEETRREIMAKIAAVKAARTWQSNGGPAVRPKCS